MDATKKPQLITGHAQMPKYQSVTYHERDLSLAVTTFLELSQPKTCERLYEPSTMIVVIIIKSLLVLQNFTIARKSGNIQYAKRMFPLFRAIVIIITITRGGATGGVLGDTPPSFLQYLFCNLSQFE